MQTTIEKLALHFLNDFVSLSKLLQRSLITDDDLAPYRGTWDFFRPEEARIFIARGTNDAERRVEAEQILAQMKRISGTMGPIVNSLSKVSARYGIDSDEALVSTLRIVKSNFASLTGDANELADKMVAIQSRITDVMTMNGPSEESRAIVLLAGANLDRFDHDLSPDNTIASVMDEGRMILMGEDVADVIKPLPTIYNPGPGFVQNSPFTGFGRYGDRLEIGTNAGLPLSTDVFQALAEGVLKIEVSLADAFTVLTGGTVYLTQAQQAAALSAVLMTGTLAGAPTNSFVGTFFGPTGVRPKVVFDLDVRGGDSFSVVLGALIPAGMLNIRLVSFKPAAVSTLASLVGGRGRLGDLVGVTTSGDYARYFISEDTRRVVNVVHSYDRWQNTQFGGSGTRRTIVGIINDTHKHEFPTLAPPFAEGFSSIYDLGWWLTNLPVIKFGSRTVATRYYLILVRAIRIQYLAALLDTKFLRDFAAIELN
jgi:hypothetical protein